MSMMTLGPDECQIPPSYCSGSLEPETLWSRSEALHEYGVIHGGWHFNIHQDLDTRGRYRRCIPICDHDPGRHFNNPQNTTVSWRLLNMYPESCHCGLPDHGPVDWSRGLTSLDWPRGLAVSRGWFRCLSPWNHMTTESDLPPRVHRSGHELFPRINWKWERLNMRRILIPTTVIFVLKGTDDKTLQLVQMTA